MRSALKEDVKEVVICRLCLEPLYNFICVDCFLEAVKKWLRSKYEDELIPAIERRHEELKRLLSSDFNCGTCIKCKSEVTAWACPCCYLYEMYCVIKTEKPELAKEFESMFNYDFLYRHGYSQLTFWQSLNRQILSTRNFQPVIIAHAPDKRNKPDMCICENCGQPSARLKKQNGSWLCESCRE